MFNLHNNEHLPALFLAKISPGLKGLVKFEFDKVLKNK